METETKQLQTSVKSSFWKISPQRASFRASQLLLSLGPQQNLDAVCKSVVGFSIRFFWGEIRSKNSERQRNARYVTSGNLSIIKLSKLIQPKSPYQWSKLQENQLKCQKVIQLSSVNFTVK